MLRRVAIFPLLLLLTASNVSANPVRTERTEARLVSEVAAIAPGQSFDVALRLMPDEGWHTYWVNPGDSGAATTVRWKLPEGFTAGDLRWPPPERIAIPPLLDFGYRGEAFLTARVTAPANLKPGGTVTLAASARWLVCEQVCIPGRAELSLTLRVRVRAETDARWTARFERARREEPAELTGWRVRTEGDAVRPSLRFFPPLGTSLAELRAVDFFPDRQGAFDHAAQPPVELVDDSLRFALPRSRGEASELDAVSGVLTLRTGEGVRAYRVHARLASVATKSAGGVDGWRMLLLAALGGLLLNLMPCVFPVISVKVLSFVRKAGESPAGVRAHALVFASGVLVSFWTLAGALLAARAAGEGLGWGFQLQSPVFVTALALLFFMLGLNLLGAFEIGTRWMGLGQGLAGAGGYAGSFFSGVLATVVATPCTAPFMGAALGYALAQPAPVALAVFTALGIGMLAPYLALAFAPGLAARLPKPGRWMETLKQFLAFPLFATAVWLLWTLAQQAGPDAAARALAGMVAIGLGVWTAQRWPGRGLAGAAGLALGLAGALLALSGSRAAADRGGWEPWSEARVEALTAEGVPVFVDFTAAWCITCQVNKRVTFDRPEVRARLAELRVATLRADWTNQDPAITAALARMGRSGVPVYALYAGRPGEPPQLLPEVLTPAGFIETLDRALAPTAEQSDASKTSGE